MTRELVIFTLALALIGAIAYCLHLEQQIVLSSSATAKVQSSLDASKRDADFAAENFKKCESEKGWLQSQNDKLVTHPKTTEEQALHSVGKTASVLGLDLGPVVCATDVGSYNDTEAMCWVIVRHGGNGGKDGAREVGVPRSGMLGVEPMKKQIVVGVLFLLACEPPSLKAVGIGIPAPVVVSSTASTKAPEPEVLLPHQASYTTWFHGTEVDGRVQNILLVGKKLLGVEIKPGEEFSFNKTVGPRTEDAGFKNAPALFLGELTEALGGGTCQVSSTLHAALLETGILPEERHPHSRPSTYIPPGLDATVSYPEACLKKTDPAVCYDLRFKNPYAKSLHIQVEVDHDLDDDTKWSLTIGLSASREVDLIESEYQWHTWSTPAFKTRHRTVSYWKDSRSRIKQAGHPGLEGGLYLTRTFPDGHEEKSVLPSKYQPTPEIWEVGTEWKEP